MRPLIATPVPWAHLHLVTGQPLDDKREAVLYSVGANHGRGLRRSNEDKRKAVSTLLADAEWAAWSNIAIARACGVSDRVVGLVRTAISEPFGDSGPPVTRTVERVGETYEQKTANIGKARPGTRPLTFRAGSGLAAGAGRGHPVHEMSAWRDAPTSPPVRQKSTVYKATVMCDIGRVADLGVREAAQCFPKVRPGRH